MEGGSRGRKGTGKMKSNQSIRREEQSDIRRYKMKRRHCAAVSFFRPISGRHALQ